MILHLQGYTGSWTNWANEMNFHMKHAPGAGSITEHVDQQSSALPLYHGYPQLVSDIFGVNVKVKLPYQIVLGGIIGN